MKVKSFFSIGLALLFIALSSCKDREEYDPSGGGNISDNAYVNNWMYEQMDLWYLWGLTEPQPNNLDIDPAAYFDRLLNKTEDRFSWCVNNFDDLINWTNGISTDIGFEYYTIQEEKTGLLYYLVVYVKPNTDAAAKSIKRGDVILAVNGVSLTESNYGSLLSSNATGTYALSINGKTDPVSIQPMVNYAENPIYYSNIYIKGDKKIGYLVYNSFNADKGDSSNSYDIELMNKLKEFYDANITDLVLDFRYNGGGLVKSAQYLSSALVKNRDPKVLFARNEYSKNVTTEVYKMSQTDQNDWLYDYFLDKYTVVSSKKSYDIPRLGDKINKVYVLTGKFTASSSELVINSLKPHMDVVLIGQKTYGKNVASVTIYEENDNRNKWGLQPIVLKMYNSAGESDYSVGFNPDVLVNEFEYEIKQFGDEDEVMLSTAMAKITGVSNTDASSLRSTSVIRSTKEVSSKTFKRGSLDMFVDRERFNRIK